MKKAKFLSLVLAYASCACILLTSCGGLSPNEGMSNPENESFLGKVSDETYPTVEEAAKAFVRNEIKGNALKAAYLSYEKKGKVRELGSLPLGKVDRGEIASAELGELSYRIKPADSEEAPEEGWTECERSVCFLALPDSYRYFCPAEKTGNRLSKSYYEEMWRSDRFLNCTQHAKNTITIEMKQGGMSFNAELTVSVDVKTDTNIMRLQTTVKMQTSGDGSAAGDVFEQLLGPGSRTSVSAFVVQKGKRVWYCTQESDVWRATLVEGVENLSQWYSENNDSQPLFFDHSYFIKTDEGFSLAPEGQALFAENLASGFYEDGADISGNVEYTVSGGNVAKSKLELDLSVSRQKTSIAYGVSALCTYSGFGSTSVTIPADFESFLSTL